MSFRIDRLPHTREGYPVPWFVAWIDGKPDFRVIRPGGVSMAVQQQLCWVCGLIRGAWSAFVIGSMCAVNRVSSEPPSHRDCAIYAAKHCPFLSKPNMRRRESNLPTDVTPAGGVPIDRNPGVALVWVTRKFSIFRDPAGAPLFDVGEPSEVLWFAEGRAATRDEVLASIDSGMPILRAEAEREDGALAELSAQYDRAMTLVPA
jgi:hypothetical protein